MTPTTATISTTVLNRNPTTWMITPSSSHAATSSTSAATTVLPMDLGWDSFIAGISLDDAELLVDQSRDLAAVGAALGLAHDLPDDRTDRLRAARPTGPSGPRLAGHG